MKKILSFILAALLCVGLCLPAFAAAPTATFSDDLRTVYFNEAEYIRFDAEYYDDYTYEKLNVKIGDSQKAEIKEAKLYADKGVIVIKGKFKYTDGSEMTAYYVKSDVYSDVEKIVNGKNVEAVIDFVNVSDITVTTGALKSGDKKTFLIENTTLTFEVSAYAADGIAKFTIGLIAVYDGAYYYFDYAENAKSLGLCLSPWAYVIDENHPLYRQIDASVQKYYNTGFGFLYSDNLVNIIAIISLLLMFFIAPAVIAVIFTVKAIIKKGTYRKIYIVIASLSAALLIVSVIISVII